MFLVGYVGLLVFLVVIMLILQGIINIANRKEFNGFIEENPDLDSNQQRIIKILIKNRRISKLAKSLIRNDYVVHLSDYAKENYKRTLLTSIFPFDSISKRERHIQLPHEIFEFDGVLIKLKTDNIELIKKYLKIEDK